MGFLKNKTKKTKQNKTKTLEFSRILFYVFLNMFIALQFFFFKKYVSYASIAMVGLSQKSQFYYENWSSGK